MENKSSVELLDEKNELRSKIDGVIANAETEERELTEVEETQLKEYRSAMDNIDAELNRKNLNNINLQTTNVRKMKEFRIVDAIKAKLEKRDFNDAENEMNARGKEQLKEAGVAAFADIYVPIENRTLQATTATKGEEAVPELKLSILPALRNNMVLNELGATFLTGQSANLSLPIYDGSNVDWADSENAQAANGEGSFSEKIWTPKRITAKVPISLQLIMQSNDDIEALIRQDLINAVSEKLEETLLGDAAATAYRPAGLFENAETKTASWQTMVEMEQKLLDNKVRGNFKFVCSPAILSTLKNTFIGGTKSDIRTVAMGDGFGGNTIDGVPVSVTPAAKGIAIGRWEDYVVAQFGSLAIKLDDMTSYDSAIVNLIVHMWVDAKPRRDVAFVPVKF